MKSNYLKFIIISFAFFAIDNSQGQVNRKYGLGIQIINPTGGISGKLAVTNHFSAQAILGFIGGSTSYPGLAVMSYSGRGVFLLRDQDKNAIPYTFLSVGVLMAQSKGSYGSIGGVRGYAPGWNVGGGLEFLPFGDFGFNIEYAYGAITVNKENGAEIGASLWGGIHYYFNH